jgi:hypothetical protein
MHQLQGRDPVRFEGLPDLDSLIAQLRNDLLLCLKTGRSILPVLSVNLCKPPPRFQIWVSI